MSAIAPALQEYFTQRLIGQRQASPHTVTAYRDCFRLLFAYLAQTSGKQPAELGFEDLDADTISGFLTHLEKQRGVSITTRNARLVEEVHRLTAKDADYATVQTLLMTHLPHDPALFNEFHALLVRVGKEHCRTRPRCEGCPLRYDLRGRPPRLRRLEGRPAT